MDKVTIIGAGLAGCEAAYYIAQKGYAVQLYDMKPTLKTPAHELNTFAELVCSNSLRSNRLENAVGLLKEELRILGSLIMEAADTTQVPAGGALAVDRTQFSQYIDEKIRNHENITVVEQEVTSIPPKGIVLLATGPLTSDALAEDVRNAFGVDGTYFYDAVAPIVDVESINMDIAFRGSRYDRGDDYINCPMNEAEYNAFYEALIQAETTDIHGFEEKHVFEGCMPIESMAKRGKMTMAFGPLKPVGMTDPRTDQRPFAIVQLRQDNASATMYNMVGFQTRLKMPEQKRVFSMIPGLENAVFLRYGVMHRNTYINSPQVLSSNLEAKHQSNLFVAGQMMGVEGYVESTASGMWAGMQIVHRLRDEDCLQPDDTTMIGAMIQYCTLPVTDRLEPMNANFGLIAPLAKRVRKKRDRAAAYAERALDQIRQIAEKQ